MRLWGVETPQAAASCGRERTLRPMRSGRHTRIQQGATLKACAAFCLRLSNSPITREGYVKNAIIPIFCAALAVSGCVTLTPEEEAAYQQRQLALEQDAAREVTCDDPEDCEVKWARAVQWTLDNINWRIEIQTDTLIQTAGPFTSLNLATTISKVPLGNGRARFELRAGCDSYISSLCTPSALQARAFFARSVMDGVTGRQEP